MSRPKTIFGCALIGINFNTPKQVQEVLDQLKALNIDRLDTAARYSPSNPGSSERLLGDVRAAEQGFTIDTKIDTGGDGSGTLAPAAISNSMNESAARLKIDKVHTLYFHRPDPQTPIFDQAAEINRLYLEGHFEKVSAVLFNAGYGPDCRSLVFQTSRPNWLPSFLPFATKSALSSPAYTKGCIIFLAARARNHCFLCFGSMALYSMHTGSSSFTTLVEYER